MERKKRVNIDKSIEVIVTNNSTTRIIFDNVRLTTQIDLHQKGDEEYITVGDLRTLINANRKLFESFTLIITDIVDGAYTLEDLIAFVGLEKAYKEYYSLRPNNKDKSVSVEDIENFILKSNSERFATILKDVSVLMRNKIIEESIMLFRDGKLTDFNKMQAIEEITKNEELFLDVRESMAY